MVLFKKVKRSKVKRGVIFCSGPASGDSGKKNGVKVKEGNGVNIITIDCVYVLTPTNRKGHRIFFSE